MSRYIEVDDVANAIYHHFPSIRTMADAKGIIEEAPSIDIPQWIPCNEKMPSEDELVLVSGEYIEYPCVISKGEYVHYWYSKGIVGIAWMPLPKPYTADRKTEQTEREGE